MKQGVLGGTLAAALALAGCSSVDQVPLVYVSTLKVGVNVESGSAEAPGAKLMIGVDATDAAYVPIAVARTCKGDTVEMMKVCINEMAQILPIRGSSENFTQNDRLEFVRLAAETKNLSTKLNEADQAYSAALQEEPAALAAVAEAVEAGKQLSALEEQRATIVALEGIFEQESELGAARSLAQQLEPRKTALDAIKSRQRSARTAIEKARTDLSGLLERFESLIPEANGNSLGQTDALSVFGTFSGDVKATAGDGVKSGVKLGKSFSTGIAAQNLALGFADRERETAKNRAACITAAAQAVALLPEADRSDVLLEKVLAKCD